MKTRRWHWIKRALMAAYAAGRVAAAFDRERPGRPKEKPPQGRDEWHH